MCRSQAQATYNGSFLSRRDYRSTVLFRRYSPRDLIFPSRGEWCMLTYKHSYTISQEEIPSRLHLEARPKPSRCVATTT